jgi:hypothetical protein
MNRLGLVWKFSVNRALTQDEERDRFLVDHVYSGVMPRNMMSIIKINSTYLECCDKFYIWKGKITGFAILALIVWFIAVIYPIYSIFFALPPLLKAERGVYFIQIIAISSACFIPAMIILWFLGMGKECFRYTHYPIRFNRKTRMVHVFRLDGTVMSEPWEKLYFTLGDSAEAEQKEVRMHRMAEDGKTVLETYALPRDRVEWTLKRENYAYKQWEFIRGYMETGPAKLLPFVDYVLDEHIGPDKRESFGHAFAMIEADTGSVLSALLFPLTLMYVMGRMIAMRTCKQPVWPADIETVCVIEPDDLYRMDAEHLQELEMP